MVVEAQGVLTCRSSTLAILDDFVLFHGLLHIDLGFRSDFHGYSTPMCAYVQVINSRSFGRFWPDSWIITHRYGVPKRFTWLTYPKVRLRA